MTALCLLVACGGEPPNSGAIYVSYVEGVGPTATSFVSATAIFRATPLSDLLGGEFIGCTVVDEVGDCQRIECPSGMTTALVSQSAGELEFTRDGAPLLSLMLTSGVYGGSASDVTLATHQELAIRASGGAVPPFDTVIVMPAPASASLPATISRAAPLTVTWSAGVAADDVTLAVSYNNPDPAPYGFVTCRGPAIRGSTTIDPRLFEGIGPDASGTVGLSSSNATQLVAGDHLIEVRANRLASFSSVTFE